MEIGLVFYDSIEFPKIDRVNKEKSISKMTRDKMYPRDLPPCTVANVQCKRTFAEMAKNFKPRSPLSSQAHSQKDMEDR